MKHLLCTALLAFNFCWISSTAFAQDAVDLSQVEDLAIPYEKFILDNGLTLVVHEDKKAPIVGVNVWYHVGSKDEQTGRTGLAHLFEHLMFNGSEIIMMIGLKPLIELAERASTAPPTKIEPIISSSS